MRPVGSKYLLEEPLGRGATGTVWRARVRDESAEGGMLPAPVAIKVLKEELAADPDVVMRFLRERSVLLRLIHPNIVRVRDLVVEGELLALVMDLVDGPDLNRYLREHGPLSPVAGALLMAQIADALAASHADGVVHRDLKPANVLMATVRDADPGRGDADRSAGGPAGGERMHPLLTDFGIARLADSPGLTRTHEFVGTPAYVAPESAEGREQTSAVDIYGAGIMLFELLTGKPPFHGDGPLQILHAHLTQEPERPRNLPEPLWIVIQHCLRKDASQRPTAVTLATALRTVAAGVGVHASPAQIDAALAVGALLAPPPSAGNEPTVPRGVRYDPNGATVLGGVSYPFGAADPTQVLPPGAEARTQRIAPSTGAPQPERTRVLPPVPAAVQATQAGQPSAEQPPQGPHPWESQLRAARTRNEQTRVDYRFPAEPEPQPQVAPPPYRAAPQAYQQPQQPAPYPQQPYPAQPYPQSQPQPQAYREPQPYPQQPQPQAQPPARTARSAPPATEPRPAQRPAPAPEPEPRREREPRPPRRPRRRMRIPGGGCLKVLLVLAVIAACVWYFTPVQDWIHHVEAWWHQFTQWWDGIVGTADKVKKGVDSVTGGTSPSNPKG